MRDDRPKARPWAVLLVAVLLAAGGAPVGAGPAQSEPDIEGLFETLGSMLGVAEIAPEELVRRVEEVGGLRFRRAVPIELLPREELGRYLERLFEEEYPPEMARREQRMLEAFGLLERGDDLRAMRRRVLHEAIAGFYDERPAVRRLFAVSSSERLGLMNQLVLAHELRHALQDQYVGLRAVLGNGTDYDDRRLAALSLYEGDATLVMQRYFVDLVRAAAPSGGALEPILGGLGGASDARSMAAMFAGPELRAAPPVVREQLVAPYLEGLRLVEAIVREGGIDLLNRKLAEPPRSMEQVLHPEKYLVRPDEPVEPPGVSLAASATMEGRLGELLIRVLLRGTVAESVAEAAAAGWGGDRYLYFDSAAEGRRLVWHTVWDTDRDAAEFYDALARYAAVRFGDGPGAGPVGSELRIEAGDGSVSLLRREGRAVRLERRRLP